MNHDLVQLLSAHHAVCIEGEGDAGRTEMFGAIEAVFGITAHGHPDLYRYAEPKLSIESARRIREGQVRRPVSASHTVFVVETDSIPQESQNALLKSFEDPSATTVFVVRLPHIDGLLPTLRSRLAVYRAEAGEQTPGPVAVSAFLAAPPSERLEMLVPLIDGKDRAAVRRFFDACERALVARSRAHGRAYTAQQRKELEAVTRCKQYVEDPGSSVKLLLEYIALRVECGEV
ncbi:MAG: hypothetical protein WD049_01330 [Candidatus Paceibacterota bacterium]